MSKFREELTLFDLVKVFEKSNKAEKLVGISSSNEINSCQTENQLNNIFGEESVLAVTNKCQEGFRYDYKVFEYLR